jgi:hypothetical protein
MNKAFEEHKLRRALDRSGKTFEFFRAEKNEFGEPVAVQTERHGGKHKRHPATARSLRGIFHEINYYVRLNTGGTALGDTTQVRQTPGRPIKQPMILCWYESVAEANLQAGDYTIINGKRFNVTGVQNVQEWNIIADISLEVVDDGFDIAV